MLQQGKTYAWQIKGNVLTGSGTQILYSTVYWFKIEPQANGSGTVVSRIEISPAEITMVYETTQQFTVLAYNQNNELIQINPAWKLVPSSEGTVSSSGLFTSGKHPKMIAVSAEYQGLRDYATVKVLPAFEGWDIELFLKQVFGLPNNH